MLTALKEENLAGRIKKELNELAHIVERAEQIWAQAENGQNDYYVDAVALNLHNFYAGIERILEHIASQIDHSPPQGANWDQELLRQMTVDVPHVRPAVLRSETQQNLNRYRGFRHVVRNVYTFKLDPEQIALLMKHLPPTMTLAEADLVAFADLLETWGQ